MKAAWERESDIWYLVGVVLATVCLIVVLADAAGTPKQSPVKFRGIALKADSLRTEVYQDSTKATYVRMILKDNGDGSLTTESGHLMFIASPAWADSTKRQAIIMLFRAQEVLRQATEALRK